MTVNITNFRELNVGFVLNCAMKLRINEVLYQLRFFFIPYLIILSSCLIIKLLYTRESIYFEVNGHHYAYADRFFCYATDFGNGLAVPIIAVILLLYSRRKAFLLVSSFLVAALLCQIIKRIVHAPRPSIYFKDQLTHIYFIKGIRMLSWNSFPSGHTVQAFTLAVVLSYVTPKKRWGFIYLLLALFIGYSRMYLSQHFFEDVVAGSIIGSISTLIWLTIIDSKPFLHTQGWLRGYVFNKD